jgi:L-malate glycosyltransferase
MKRILVIPTWYPTNLHPINGVFIRQQVLALSKKFHVAVLVPCFINWRHIFKGTVTCRSVLEEQDGIFFVNEGRTSHIPRIPKLSHALYAKVARDGFEKLLSEWGRPDIIHAHVVLPAGWAATLLGRQYGIPVVLTEHSGPFSMHLKNATNRRLVKETLTHVDRLVTVSPALARQIQGIIPTVDPQIVGNIINTDFFTPPDAQPKVSSVSPCRFLSVAVLKKPKGMRYLIEAARILIQRGHRTFELIIGGDGPERPGLEKLAGLMGLTEICRFPGMFTPSEVRDRMQHCDVFVLPSLQETFGIVLAEAMSCGKPVISTRSGGPEFIVTPDTGILVDVADPVALADTMEKFILRQVSYDYLKVRQSIIDRFSEEAFLRDISAVYEEACSARVKGY